jgi:hypothetical protein
MRRTLLLSLGLLLLLVPTSTASAGALGTQNACYWSLDGYWRHLTVDLAGTGTPAPAAPGSTITLTGASVHARLPDYLAQAGHTAGLLKAGENDLQAKVWVALEGVGTTQGVQVLALDTVARTTITETPDGLYAASTPIDVTVPLPDTTWTAQSTAVAFRQAGAGTLPALPVGASGRTVPLGSAFISASIGGSTLRLNVDCQPGQGEGKAAPAPLAAGAFETVAVGSSTVPVLPTAKPQAPVAKAPALTVRSTKLKVSGRRTRLALACAEAECKGTVTVKFSGRSAARKVTYTLAAGARRTLKLDLSAAARTAVKRKRLTVSVRVSVRGGKTVTKTLRLS